jgi:AcrR family transcriptional regulator
MALLALPCTAAEFSRFIPFRYFRAAVESSRPPAAGACTMDRRADLFASGLEIINAAGFDGASAGAICAAAGVADDALEGLFRSKEGFAAELYFDCLRGYHRALLAPLTPRTSARRGVDALVRAHLGWIVAQRAQAQFLFDHARADPPCRRQRRIRRPPRSLACAARGARQLVPDAADVVSQPGHRTRAGVLQCLARRPHP